MPGYRRCQNRRCRRQFLSELPPEEGSWHCPTCQKLERPKLSALLSDDLPKAVLAQAPRNRP